MKRYVIVVAGGVGKRMGASIPKQFIRVADAPVLVHTLRRFQLFDADIHPVVVLHNDYLQLWTDLAQAHQLPNHDVVTGGAERFDSVARGLERVPDEALVAIHDAVRPFVSVATISRCFEQAAISGAAIPIVPVTDSLRKRSSDHTSEAVNRADFVAVQTPQCFNAGLLKAAYRQEFKPGFTDDASVVEAYGHPITLVAGNTENIKLTTPNDLVWAELILRKSHG